MEYHVTEINTAGVCYRLQLRRWLHWNWK